MGRIQSGVGVFTGVPIAETVEKLISFSAVPRDRLAERNQALEQQQVAITELAALALSLQFSAARLQSAGQFDERFVKSSDTQLLSASNAGNPETGSHRFTPLRQAQSHQLMSSGFVATDQPIGKGSFSLRHGGFVDDGILLDSLNGGNGVERGEIRITDRSGSSAVVDLRHALTIDDVLGTINASEGINVTAVAEGDQIRLIDNTGQASAHLRVQEVGLGRAAADLGLASIDVAAAEAAGTDVLSLSNNVTLGELNDGNGVHTRLNQDDLDITLSDGSQTSIDFTISQTVSDLANGTTDAANGLNAQVTFTAKDEGSALAGVTVIFVDTQNVSRGEETVRYEVDDKLLIFDIESGETDAADIVSALEGNSTVSELFTAQANGTGAGKIDLDDRATTVATTKTVTRKARTVGEILDVINNASPSQLSAAISADGDRLVLTDLTSGGGTLSVTSRDGGTTAEDLGLTNPASSGTISGRRLRGGLKTVLVDSLGGGTGFALGSIMIQDRNGSSAVVNLSTAESLDDIIGSINTMGIGVEASINRARNGIKIADISGGSGNLIVSNVGATQTADDLGIAIDQAISTVDSGALGRKTVTHATSLASLDGGNGVTQGSFIITDSSGFSGGVNLVTESTETVGDVIASINSLSIGVEARINDSGDGILLIDTAGGAGTLRVEDIGVGNAASGLNIAGESTEIDIDGTPTQAIVGSSTHTIDIAPQHTLEDLVASINQLDAGVAASIVNTGSGTAPYRIALSGIQTGRAGQLLVDSSSADFSFHEVARAQDALLLLGNGNAPGAGLLVSSPTDSFDEVVPGVSLTINGTSDKPVTVDITTSNSKLTSNIQGFVDQFNNLRERLDELTFFNQADNTTGILFASNEALRLDSGLSNVITSRYSGVGSVKSLGELGLSLDSEGVLSFSKSKFNARFDNAPEAIQRFFTNENLGFVARAKSLIDRLAGDEHSLLTSRAEALRRTIDSNAKRLDFLSQRLDQQRERLLKEFFAMENAIGKLRSDLNVISSLSSIAPLSINLGQEPK